MNNTDTAIDSMNEQMKQFGDMQQRSLEPMRAFGAVAVDAFEQMTRKNYALVGDMIDYTVKQASLPLKGEGINETIAAQISESKAFAELMNQRSGEYMDLVNSLGGKFREAGDEAAATLRSA